MEQARVVDLQLTCAPDSAGLVVVVLAYPNGAHARMQLDGEATQRLIEELCLESIRDLLGRSFADIARALPANA